MKFGEIRIYNIIINYFFYLNIEIFLFLICVMCSCKIPTALTYDFTA